MNRTELSDEEFIKIVETAQSMFYAAKLCGMAYTSFIRRAKKFGIYKPNQGGVGIVKKQRCTTTPLRKFRYGLLRLQGIF